MSPFVIFLGYNLISIAECGLKSETLRQYLPKGVSIAGLSQRQCNAIARKLSTRLCCKDHFRG
jgi:hypothetical protein